MRIGVERREVTFRVTIESASRVTFESVLREAGQVRPAVPAGQGDKSGGDRRMVAYLARAAVACGCNGVFLETHPRPDEAKSDGPNSIALDDLPALVETCLRLPQALVAPG